MFIKNITLLCEFLKGSTEVDELSFISWGLNKKKYIKTTPKMPYTFRVYNITNYTVYFINHICHEAAVDGYERCNNVMRD